MTAPSPTVESAIRQACVYCHENRRLTPEQVLVSTERAFLCAPRGQVVEGYLAVATRRCVGALARAGRPELADVLTLQATVRRFYRRAYGASAVTFYEQGRGGGGARFDPTDRFPHHAHLCGIPAATDVHSVLGDRYRRVDVAGLEEVAEAAAGQPYVYVEAEARDGHRRCVYVARTAGQRAELEGLRLKPRLAELLGVPERWDWRTYPGERELRSTIDRFTEFVERRA